MWRARTGSVDLSRARGEVYTPVTVSRSSSVLSVRRERARKAALDAVAAWHARFDPRDALSRDPLRFARRYAEKRDREVVAMLSALMAFGRVSIIGARLEVLFSRLGPSPAGRAMNASRDELLQLLGSFKHRTFRGEDIALLVHAMGVLLRRDGGLYVSLERAYEETRDLRESLGRWTDSLRALAWPEGATRSARHLLPDPRGPSASKRLNLLLRWVARPDDGIDLGLSRLPTSALLVPVDVHVHRIARNLGFTARNDASWRTAEEITAVLRTLSSEDPVRYDMALCHLGIARQCPSKRDPVRCDGCALRDVCVHWK